MTNDLDTAIHTYLTTAPASGFAGQPVRTVDAWPGAENLLWRVESRDEQAAVKLFLDAGQVRGRRQFDGQHLFAEHAIAAQPLWFDRYPHGLARQVLVYRWVAGDAIESGDAAALQALAHVAAQVHNSDVTAVSRFCPKAINLDYFWRILFAGLESAQRWCQTYACTQLAGSLQRLQQSAAATVSAGEVLWLAAPPTPVHGDLALAHAINTDGAIVLLDWEMFGLGDPALEIAQFLATSQSMLDASTRADWLEDYLVATRVTECASRIAIYERLLPLDRLSFLLNGLRQLTAAERKDEDYRSRSDFLVETILTSLYGASMALDCKLAPAATLRPEIGHLVA